MVTDLQFETDFDVWRVKDEVSHKCVPFCSLKNLSYHVTLHNIQDHWNLPQRLRSN